MLIKRGRQHASQSRTWQTGFTLIELMIGIVIFAIVLALGMPSFSDWIRNTRIRNFTESIVTGLNVAKAEAVRRNALVRFQVVGSLNAGCALSAAGTSWMVSLDAPTGTGSCDQAPSDTLAPRIIQKQAAQAGANLTVAGADLIRFNGVGRATFPVGVNDVNINVGVAGGVCATSDAPNGLRCLSVVVSSSGQVRMCDPALVSTDSRACP